MSSWSKILIMVSLAMQVWGSQASASLPAADLAGDIEKISAWTAYLNSTYPDLQLRVAISLDRDQSARAVLREINQLKDELAGVRDFPAGAFTTLACNKPECDHN